MRSLTFFAVVSLLFVLYGAMHYYVYAKLHPLLPGYRWPLIATLVLLWCSLFAVEWLTHRNGAPTLVLPLAWLTFSWMGLVFLFFFISTPIDVLALSARVAGFYAGGIDETIATSLPHSRKHPAVLRCQRTQRGDTAHL